MIKNDILTYLETIINIKQSKHRNYIYTSKQCPFSDYFSNTPIFRYNIKLKVGKCYCCGKSFKELYWLKLNITDPIKIKHIHILHDKLISNDIIRNLHIEKLYKDKNNVAYSNSEKFKDDDLDYPF